MDPPGLLQPRHDKPAAGRGKRAQSRRHPTDAGGSGLGLTAGASAPEVLVEEIIEKFRARYDVAIEAVRTAFEDVIFKIPRVLQPAAAQ